MEPIVLARFIHFAATLAVAGTIWFALMVPAKAAPKLASQLRQLAWAALSLAILSGTAWLVLVAADILDTPVLDAVLKGAVVTETRFGQVTAARLFIALVLMLLALWPRTRPVQAVLALALVTLPAVTGHAGAAPGPAGTWVMAADMTHLAAAAAWLGALPAFAILMRGSGYAAEAVVVPATRRFSHLAVLCVAVLVLSGLINSWYMLNSPSDLLTTDYGRLLSLKVILFATMLAIAAANRFRLTPKLPAGGARSALARNTLIETTLGLGVIAAVAVLGTLPPAGHAHTAAAVPPDASFVHIHDERGMADVMIDPGRVGHPAVTIRLWREDLSELPAQAVTVALKPPGNAAGAPPGHAAVRQPDGRWLVDAVDLPRDGTWTVRVRVIPEDGSAFVLDGPIVIGP